jgi:hypothetical protein
MMKVWKNFWRQFHKEDRWIIALILISGTLLIISQVGKIITMFLPKAIEII